MIRFVCAEEPARPVVRLRVAFGAQLGGPAREQDHCLRRCGAVRRRVARGCREITAVLSGAGMSGAKKLEILREGLPEYGKTCRCAAQLVEPPLQPRLLSLHACSSALQAARPWLRDVSFARKRRVRGTEPDNSGRTARKPAGYSSKID